MKAELETSNAVPKLMSNYTGFMDSMPGPLQLALLLAQKYSKVRWMT